MTVTVTDPDFNFLISIGNHYVFFLPLFFAKNSRVLIG